MGKIQLHTSGQQSVLDQVKEWAFFKQNFYFTGGTALSAVYLNHRLSEDLDFFSTKKLENEIIFIQMQQLAKKLKAKLSSRFADVVYIFNLSFPNGEILKVDFAYYPYKSLEQPQLIEGVRVDSKFDIATNKMLTISQRTQVKDFVDLYYLLERFTISELMHAVEDKFKVEMDPFMIAFNFLKVDGFESLPTMIKPLKLEELQKFFREKASQIGKRSVK